MNSPQEKVPDGISVGISDGVEVGAVGVEVGMGVGEPAFTEGPGVGADEGRGEGAAVVGRNVGTLLGIPGVGLQLGTLEGEAVGRVVGVALGLEVGRRLGREEKNLVGDVVGGLVGQKETPDGSCALGNALMSPKQAGRQDEKGFERRSSATSRGRLQNESGMLVKESPLAFKVKRRSEPRKEGNAPERPMLFSKLRICSDERPDRPAGSAPESVLLLTSNNVRLDRPPMDAGIDPPPRAKLPILMLFTCPTLLHPTPSQVGASGDRRCTAVSKVPDLLLQGGTLKLALEPSFAPHQFSSFALPEIGTVAQKSHSAVAANPGSPGDGDAEAGAMIIPIGTNISNKNR